MHALVRIIIINCPNFPAQRCLLLDKLHSLLSARRKYEFHACGKCVVAIGQTFLQILRYQTWVGIKGHDLVNFA
jgi:hypothetical protein